VKGGSCKSGEHGELCTAQARLVAMAEIFWTACEHNHADLVDSLLNIRPAALSRLERICTESRDG
jgi:hypothetical protein